MILYKCDICGVTSEECRIVEVTATTSDTEERVEHRCQGCLGKVKFDWGHYEDPIVRAGGIG